MELFDYLMAKKGHNTYKDLFSYLLGNSEENEYTPIEYLTVTGRQYVEIPNLIPNNHKLELKFQNTLYNDDNHVFGAEYTGSYNDGARYWSLTIYNNKYYWGYNGTEGNGGTWNNTVRIFVYNDFNNHEISLDGVVLESGKEISTQGHFLWFRRANRNSSYAYYGMFRGRFYYGKIWDRTTGALVANFIPVMRNSDNVYGLYDTVSKTFYRSQSGTDFPSN